MAINKFTQATFRNGELPDENIIYAQREGEAGLSQKMTINFDGFTAEEKRGVMDVMSEALRARIFSMGAWANETLEA